VTVLWKIVERNHAPLRIKRVAMTAQIHFKNLAIGQKFEYLARTFTKTAFSLAVDVTNDEFIFMGEIWVEPLEIEERNAVKEACAV
jgi:hypothetical protein